MALAECLQSLAASSLLARASRDVAANIQSLLQVEL
jgi:hypothetical protein